MLRKIVIYCNFCIMPPSHLSPLSNKPLSNKPPFWKQTKNKPPLYLAPPPH